jgi:hypothetical protein
MRVVVRVLVPATATSDRQIGSNLSSTHVNEDNCVLLAGGQPGGGCGQPHGQVAERQAGKGRAPLPLQPPLRVETVERDFLASPPPPPPPWGLPGFALAKYALRLAARRAGPRCGFFARRRRRAGVALALLRCKPFTLCRAFTEGGRNAAVVEVAHAVLCHAVLRGRRRRGRCRRTCSRAPCRRARRRWRRPACRPRSPPGASVRWQSWRPRTAWPSRARRRRPRTAWSRR